MLRWAPSVCAVFATVSSLAAEPEPNAALLYWHAFATMPQFKEKENELLGEWATVPANDAARAVVGSCEYPLRILRRAASVRRAWWGVPLREEGPMAQMPHLSKARELSRVACLSARLHLEAGNASAAVDDIVSVVVMARHMGRDGSLIGCLVQFAIENTAVELTAKHLPKFKPDDLKKLSDRLAALPPRSTARESVLVEKDSFLNWTIAELRKLADTEGRFDVPGIKRFLAMMSGEGDGLKVAEHFLKLVGGKVEPAIALVEECRTFYDEQARIMDLPADKYEAAAAAFEKRIAQAGPVTRMVMPALSKIKTQEVRIETRWSMLLAAVAAARGDAAALGATRDPLDGKPLDRKDLGDGAYELSSRFMASGQAVKLVVGK